ncbi:MAG: efflux RND transporter permease subunit, partial [Planctomycetota bacterium]|nr:efflux RND transporter permease subunit [Planctomycetota bacterium]
LRDRLRDIPHIAGVNVMGLPEPEMQVSILPKDLERWGLTLAEVSQSLGAQVHDLPAGSLETSAGAVRLRVLGEETDPDRLARRPLRSFPNGAIVRLGDVAQVRLAHEKEITLGRYNGYDSITLAVTKDSRGDVIDMVAAVEEIVSSESGKLPQGVSIGISSDFSIYVQNRLNTLLQSGFFGLALVLLMLWVFLDARIALMTAAGIPMAVMGGILLMSAFGITMNMLSMFAFILVLGMVVDDAIVVVENCYRYVEMGLPVREAALRGTTEVAWPVLTTVATTVVAFSSMLMIDGELGQWMSPVPKVASLTLAASLLEALAVLPSHFAEWVNPIPEATGETFLSKEPAARKRWYAPLQRNYERLLKTAVRHRITFATGAIGLLLCAGALFHSGHLKFVLMPDFEAKLFFLNIEAPTHYSVEQTSGALRTVDEAISELPRSEVESYVTLAGALYSDQTNYKTGSHLGQVFVELVEGGARKRSTQEIKQELRQKIGLPPGITALDFAEPQAGPTGAAIEIRLSGTDGEQLVHASEKLVSFLKSFPGVVDVKDDLLPGAREVRVVLTEEGRQLGFSETQVARQVLGSFYGDRAAILRMGRNPADLLVRNPEEARHSFALLRTMRLKTPTGQSVLFERIAQLEESRGLAEVVRRDRSRSITVTSDVTLETNAREVIAQVVKEFKDINEEFPSVTLNYGGDQEQTRESMTSLARALGFAFFIIYFLLAFLFGSYSQPFVVMASVPFAALGVLFGFTFIGEPMSFMTSLGMLALSGIAVNDALVLMDFINQHRRSGHGLVASVLRAGSVRMRPVLITSMTTISGLTPLAFFSTGQAKFLAPMAKALIFGMVSATLMTLVLVPIGFLLLADIRQGLRHLLRWPARREPISTKH